MTAPKKPSPFMQGFYGMLFILCACSTLSYVANPTSNTTPSSSSQTTTSITQQKVNDSAKAVQSIATLSVPACADKIDQEHSRSCTSCNTATVKKFNADCSLREESTSDSGCSSLCPVATPQPVYTPPPAPAAPSYSCSNKNCSQVSSCEEAMYLLNVCGRTRLDGDKDGTPCEEIC